MSFYDTNIHDVDNIRLAISRSRGSVNYTGSCMQFRLDIVISSNYYEFRIPFLLPTSVNSNAGHIAIGQLIKWMYESQYTNSPLHTLV